VPGVHARVQKSSLAGVDFLIEMALFSVSRVKY
jgi:hypothetical protein